MARRRVSARGGDSLSRTALKTIWDIYKKTGSEALRNRLADHYAYLVRLQAEKLKNSLPEHVEVDDLFQDGIVGLLDAITRFDISRGVSFGTYCMQRIRGSMLDSMRAGDWVPRQVRYRDKRLEGIRKDFIAQHYNLPAVRDYAKALKMTIGETIKWIDEAGVIDTVLSLEAIRQDAEVDESRLEALTDPRKVDIEAIARRDALLLMVSMLPRRKRRIIELYWFAGYTMSRIGKAIRLSESRVCQLHKEAMETLRGSAPYVTKAL